MVQQKPNFSDIAVAKNLTVPDENGLVLLRRDGMVKDTFFKAKPIASYSDLSPSEEEMGIINSLAIFPQRAEKYIILRGCNPLGSASQVDVQGDAFSKRAEKTMAEQGVGTPLLQDHLHNLLDALPVGFAIKTYMTSKGLREDYAIPLEDYNADIRAALLNASVTRMSVGVLVKPEDRLCSSCKTKSIYSYSCSHKPGQVDEDGNTTFVIINDVFRYIERSLCNVPVRTGTSMKALDPTHKLDSNQELAFEEKNQKLGFPPFCFTGEEFDALNWLIGNTSAYKDLPLLQARTDQVQSTQSAVDSEKVQAFVDNKNFDGGLILSRKDQLYMIDGHHRLEAAKSAGRPSIWAHTLSLPDYPVGAKIFAEQLGMNPQVLIDNMSSKALDLNQNLTAATISTVNTIEDSIVAEKTEAEKVAEEVAKALVTEAAKAEDKKPDDAEKAVKDDEAEKAKKSKEDDECMKAKEEAEKAQAADEDKKKALDPVKVEASLSEDSNLVIKSLIASNKEQAVQLSKALEAFTKQELQVSKQLEIMVEQSKAIETLCGLQKELGETVMAAANFSTQELLEKVGRFVNESETIKVQNKAIVSQPGDQLVDIFGIKVAK